VGKIGSKRELMKGKTEGKGSLGSPKIQGGRWRGSLGEKGRVVIKRGRSMEAGGEKPQSL